MRLKSAIAVAQQDRDFAGSENSQVKDPIASKICRRYSDGRSNRRVVRLWLKRAIAVAQKDRNRAAPAVAHRKVQPPVSIEISDRDRTWGRISVENLSIGEIKRVGAYGDREKYRVRTSASGLGL
jgi:hypothetical protein